MLPQKGELLIIAFLYIFAIVVFTSSEDRALAGKQPERRGRWLKHGGSVWCTAPFL